MMYKCDPETGVHVWLAMNSRCECGNSPGVKMETIRGACCEHCLECTIALNEIRDLLRHFVEKVAVT